MKALAAMLVVAASAAGISYATNAVTRASTSVLQACANATNGNLRLVASPADCRTHEDAVSWNVVGPAGPQGVPGKDGTDGVDGKNGVDGVGPIVEQLATGDPNCATGGVSITDAAGHVGYVCNGLKGDTGAGGTPFSGLFASPNGQFELSVADTGIRLEGPSSKVTLTPSSLSVESSGSMTIKAGGSLGVDAGGRLSLNGGAPTSIEGGLVSIGSGSCAPALRLTDPMFVTVPPQGGGTFQVAVSSGSNDVCIG